MSGKHVHWSQSQAGMQPGRCSIKLDPSYLKLDWKQFHVSILVQEFGHTSEVFVGMANDIHDRQQLPQRHGELGGHPALCADLASLLLYIIWL